MTSPLESHLPRSASRFFNSAELAQIPKAFEEMSASVSTDNWEKVIEDARESVGSVLAPVDEARYTYNPDEHVSLFTNTTTAFGRVLSRIDKDYRGSRPSLLTNDMEFPGCIAAIDDSWTGSVVLAQVASFASDNSLDLD
jgi:hypothetical protein